MSAIITPGQGIIYMKVGVHAKEPLDEIIARKLREIEQEGFALWGYGGNTCHPVSMVQPFASDFASRGKTIHLCMKEMDSHHFAEPVRAGFYSIDGTKWSEIPPGIAVRGSRYALAIKNLRKEAFTLPLSHSRVAVGRSRGVSGGSYIAGRVDKACLELGEFAEVPPSPDEKIEAISLVAELCEPYAVFLKN